MSGTNNPPQSQSTIDSEDKGASEKPQPQVDPFGKQVASLTPASVIFYMLDEATRRTTPQGGVEFGQLSNGTIFHHVELWKRIDEYIERLLGASGNDLATPNLACNAGVSNPQKAAQEANKAVEAKNYAYWERNQLVGVLSRLYPSHLARHDENDKEWEDDWRNIVCVHTPVGQATWHLQDDDMPMFAHLERGADHWDGHTTEEKYHRLAQLTADKEQADG